VMYSDRKTMPCRRCGATDLVIELDHIDGDPLNNAPDNVQPLCIPCHHAKTTGTPPMKVYPTKIVSIEYVGDEMTYDIEMDGPYRRFVANGLVVHNSQLSQRYVASEDLDWVCPIADLDDEEEQKLNQQAWDFAVLAYEGKVARGLVKHTINTPQGREARKIARQTARAVLPNMCETRMVVSGNYRAWMEASLKRIGSGAEPEIVRLFGQYFLPKLHQQAPSLFGPLMELR
jgi:hypothetical protein